jgi:hypothetical protein
LKDVIRPNGLPGERSQRLDDRYNAGQRRLHFSHPNAQEVLAAVTGFTSQIARLDSMRANEEFQRSRLRLLARSLLPCATPIGLGKSGRFARLVEDHYTNRRCK